MRGNRETEREKRRRERQEKQEKQETQERQEKQADLTEILVWPTGSWIFFVLFGRLDLENKIIYTCRKSAYMLSLSVSDFRPSPVKQFYFLPTPFWPRGIFFIVPLGQGSDRNPFLHRPLDLSRRPRSFTSVNAFQVAPTAPICQTSLYMDWFQNSKKRSASQISPNFHLGYIWPATPVEVEHFSHVTLVRALTEHLTARE